MLMILITILAYSENYIRNLAFLSTYVHMILQNSIQDHKNITSLELKLSK